MKEILQEKSGVFTELRHDEAVMGSPGALLRDRRLALQLSEWDIAREMRLQTQYILDLESDNFAAFSSLAFVRGYLRGYAKIVGIPEMEVIQLFNQLSLQDKVTTSVQKYVTQDRSYGDRYWRWMGLAVVGFIVLSLILWWQNYNSSLKSMNTSVSTTLAQVSTLQNALQAEKKSTETTAAASAPNQLNDALGASGGLLSGAAGSTSVPSHNNVAVPSTSSSGGAVSNSSTNAGTLQPKSTTAPSEGMPKNKTSSKSNLSRAHAPIVDGQAPRFGAD